MLQERFHTNQPTSVHQVLGLWESILINPHFGGDWESVVIFLAIPLCSGVMVTEIINDVPVPRVCDSMS